MLDHLQDFPNLEVLSLSWGTWSGDLRELQRRADGSLGEAVLPPIVRCSQLKGLDIGDCHMTDRDLPHLAELFRARFTWNWEGTRGSPMTRYVT